MPLTFTDSGPIPGGRCVIFDEPVPGMSYSLGLDCALGIPGKDSDAAVMLDLHGKQVAVLHGSWGTEIIPHLCNLIDGFGAHRVFVVGEAAKEAIPVLRHLYDQGGYWLYYARADDSRGRTVRDKLGHVPVRWDPPVRLLQTMIKAGKVEIRDQETHRQMCRFGFRPKSSGTSNEDAATDGQLTWGAPPGDHDDLCRAAALSVWGLEWLPQFEPPKLKLRKDSIGALLGWDKDEADEPKKSKWL